MIESRSADARDDRLPAIVAELVGLKPDVIVTVSYAAAQAARDGAPGIPVVFTIVPDPVGRGLVRTLARPGGNLTGLSPIMTELSGKRLELLKEAVPSLKAVTVLSNPVNPNTPEAVEAIRATAQSLGLDVRMVGVKEQGDIERAFVELSRPRTGAVVLVPDPIIFARRKEIADVATRNKLPVLGWQSEMARSGALLSYGQNFEEVYRRAAYYVDRIIKGAKPADLPVEQPTKFELVVNLKTANALGVKLPPALLQRADHVIR